MTLYYKKNETQERGLTRYLNTIGTHRLLTAREELALAKKLKTGSSSATRRDAWERLVESNLRLVVQIAGTFKRLGMPLDDLIAEGNIGLMKAAEKFDPARNCRFSTYASWWIRHYIRRALANKGDIIRVPVETARCARKAAEEKDNAAQKTRSQDTLRCASVKMLPLSERISDASTTTWQDCIPDPAATPERQLGMAEVAASFSYFIHELEERERQILVMRFGLDSEPPKTLAAVGLRLGVSIERVRCLQERAIQNLKTLLLSSQEEMLSLCADA